MKIGVARILSIVAAAGLVTVVGCGKKPGEAGVAERTGAALDKAAEKTMAVATNVAAKTGGAVKDAAVATKDVAGQVVEKSGEVMENAGSAVEKAGEDMQK